MNYEQSSGLLTMNSQVWGVLVASMVGGDEKDMQTCAWVAGNATNCNHDLYSKNADSFAKAILFWVPVPPSLSDVQAQPMMA